jgi:uroporphyrinogen decarboxylase
MLMGFNNFAMGLIREPELVSAVFEQVAKIQYSALDQVLKMPQVGAIWVVDDLAYNSGPIISVKHFEQHVFPWYKEMARRCHEAGRLFILHSDGKLDALFPSLINLGLDIIQPIDPTCNDIVEVKKKLAGRLTVVGNVPNEMLRAGSQDEVRDYVRLLLKEVAPGGGYLLGSGNSVPDWAKYENYEVMRETALNEGAYPIRSVL